MIGFVPVSALVTVLTILDVVSWDFWILCHTILSVGFIYDIFWKKNPIRRDYVELPVPKIKEKKPVKIEVIDMFKKPDKEKDIFGGGNEYGKM